MFKFAVAALLASTTLAYEYVQAYTNDATPRTILSLPDIFMSSYNYNFDFGWKGAYETAFPSDELIEDTVAIKFFSHAKVKFQFNILKIYNYDIEFSFVPVEVTPLKMYLTYTNPASIVRYQTPLTMIFKSGYETKVADLKVTWSKDLKLPKFSFYDFFFKNGPAPYPKDLTAFKFNSGLQGYEDPNLKVNLVKAFVTDTTLTSWIGKGKYCDFDFVNDDWPF